MHTAHSDTTYYYIFECITIFFLFSIFFLECMFMFNVVAHIFCWIGIWFSACWKIFFAVATSQFRVSLTSVCPDLHENMWQRKNGSKTTTSWDERRERREKKERRVKKCKRRKWKALWSAKCCRFSRRNNFYFLHSIFLFFF